MKLNGEALVWNSLASLVGDWGANPYVTVDPLPKPLSIKWGHQGPIALARNLSLSITDNDIIIKAFERSVDNMWSDNWQPSGIEVPAIDWQMVNEPISIVDVVVNDVIADLQQGVDESYNLKVSGTEISINAETIWGVLRAFTTLEQLVVSDGTSIFLEQAVSIKDEPLYSYRGVMIDTARNFYTLESLYRQIDAMSLAKMNVLHLHITDSQSWPVFVNSYPEMVKDAYSSKQIYSTDDISHLVEYGRYRGVRIIPEIDMPGHSNSGWSQIDPELVACRNYPWKEVALEPNGGQLEILNPNLYPTLEKVYNDFSAMFKDSYFHVGLDELNTGCYNTSQITQQWLKEDNRTYSDLVQYWLDHALPIFQGVEGRKLIMWEDVVTSEDMPARHLDPKDVTLQVWKGGATGIKGLTSLGYDVIVSAADFLYLDCGFAGWLPNNPSFREVEPLENQRNHKTCSFNYGGDGGSWCGPYKSWQRIYALDLTANLTSEEKKHVLGASAALWSEQTDGSIADGIIWPRTAALGELLWSGNLDSEGNYRVQDLTPRILNFRERLVQRGIRASPLMPRWCLAKPNECLF